MIDMEALLARWRSARVGATSFWIFGAALVVFGIVFLVDQVLARVGHAPFFNDWVVAWSSSTIPPLGLAAISAGTLLERMKKRPPILFTRVFGAWLGIFVGVVLFGWALAWGLSERVADGLSWIALGAALLRLIGMPFRTEEPEAPSVIEAGSGE